MTITSRVRQQFFEHTQPEQQQNQLIRIPQTRSPSRFSLACGSTSFPLQSSSLSGHNQLWTATEHDRFLQALELFPCGPWKYIATYIGTKTARQAMSHAQKYRQKIARRKRGLVQLTPSASTKATDDPLATKATPVIQQHQGPTTHHNQWLPRLEVDTTATHDRVEIKCTAISCPASPTEVSLPATMALRELDKSCSSSTTEFMPHPFPAVDPHYYCYSSSSWSHLVHSQNSDLMRHQEDHEVIVNSVSEFLDNLEVEPLDAALHQGFQGEEATQLCV